MNIVCGIDLVYLPRFKRSLKRGGENLLRRVFLEEELNYQQYREISHLAGIFAAKETVIKALNLPTDSWHDIKVVKNSKGAPTVELRTYNLELITSSLSISHDGNYVIAQFVALME